MMHTQTITRGTIKRVESRLRGLGAWTDIFGSSSTTPPIQGTSTNSQIGWDDFLGFLRGGQLKIDATQFAEGMVRIMYGLEPGCTMPQPGIPVVPNSTPPKFCSSSVAGMIERCRIYEAGAALNNVKTQFQQRMSSTSDPMAPYIKRWWDEYGANDISRLSAIIASAGGTCGITGEIPKLCTAPLVWSTSKLTCVYPTEGSQGSGLNSIVIFGGIALIAALFLMKR